MKRAKTENRGIWLRVLAGFLVFVIAFGIVVGSRTNIAVFPERELNKATRLAAVQLLAESGYANASRFGRMARYTRSVLAGKYAPEDFDQDELIDSGYYDAVCWAYENGLLKAEDGIDDSTHQIDYKTAALLIYRYAQLVGLDTSVSVLQEESYMNQYPDLPQETVDALIWVSSQDITTRDCTLAKLFENADSGLTRSQMVLFLFYLDTNCLS